MHASIIMSYYVSEEKYCKLQSLCHSLAEPLARSENWHRELSA